MSNNLITFDLGDALKLNGTVSTQNGAAMAGRTVGNTYYSVAAFLNLLVPTSFIIAGLILFFLLIGGGFSIIASGGNPKSVENGQKQIMGALIGFLLIFTAYWIIRIIEIITGLQIFSSTYF